jgi:hypothetical protein
MLAVQFAERLRKLLQVVKTDSDRKLVSKRRRCELRASTFRNSIESRCVQQSLMMHHIPLLGRTAVEQEVGRPGTKASEQTTYVQVWAKCALVALLATAMIQSAGRCLPQRRPMPQEKACRCVQRWPSKLFVAVSEEMASVLYHQCRSNQPPTHGQNA